MHNPPHPGLVLREYLADLPVSIAAAHLRTTRVTLSRLLNGKAGISANMALRLAAALDTSPELWMSMQSQYDLWKAQREKRPKIAVITGVTRKGSSGVRGRHQTTSALEKAGSALPI